jgi:hypothetical protein
VLNLSTVINSCRKSKDLSDLHGAFPWVRCNFELVYPQGELKRLWLCGPLSRDPHGSPGALHTHIVPRDRCMAVGLVAPLWPVVADVALRSNHLKTPWSLVGLHVHTYIHTHTHTHTHTLLHGVVWGFIGRFSHGRGMKSEFAGDVGLSFGFRIVADALAEIIGLIYF